MKKESTELDVKIKLNFGSFDVSADPRKEPGFCQVHSKPFDCGKIELEGPPTIGEVLEQERKKGMNKDSGKDVQEGKKEEPKKDWKERVKEKQKEIEMEL